MPQRAELLIGAVVIAVVLAADIRGAIAFSSFSVLVYYAIANASAWTLRPQERRWPRWLAGLGLAGCLLLAATLPVTGVAVGAAMLAIGATGRMILTRAGHRLP